MTKVSLIKEVSLEFTEYVGTIAMNETGDILEVEFDASLIVDQIAFNSGGTNSYKVELIYPSSEDTVELKAASSSAGWALNNKDSYGVMWHRLPRRGKVRLTGTTVSTSESLSLAILGRAG